MVRPLPQLRARLRPSRRVDPDVVCGEVDTEDQQQLAAAFRITSIPTLMAFRDGILVFSQPGALGPAQLDSLIAGVRALDMDDVRRQVAEQRNCRGPVTSPAAHRAALPEAPNASYRPPSVP